MHKLAQDHTDSSQGPCPRHTIHLESRSLYSNLHYFKQKNKYVSNAHGLQSSFLLRASCLGRNWSAGDNLFPFYLLVCMIDVWLLLIRLLHQWPSHSSMIRSTCGIATRCWCMVTVKIMASGRRCRRSNLQVGSAAGRGGRSAGGNGTELQSKAKASDFISLLASV